MSSSALANPFLTPAASPGLKAVCNDRGWPWDRPASPRRLAEEYAQAVQLACAFATWATAPTQPSDVSITRR